MFRYWLVMPAAGSGRRMGLQQPKQYLSLAGRTVVEHALAPFLADGRCAGVVVALAADDATWPTLAVAREPRVHAVTGGARRQDSVAAGLAAIAARVGAEDPWVLVHDAARPCLAAADLDALLAVLPDAPDGALLARPVADTLKRAGADHAVERTVERAALWHALTPQAFRLRALAAALGAAGEVTDESAAIEARGGRPRLVRGSARNIKVTHAADLELAAALLPGGRS